MRGSSPRRYRRGHAVPAVPAARRRPSPCRPTELHGRTRIDDYEWLREKDSPEVTAYLEAENAYTQARTAHLADLRQAIFDEIRARTRETDLSVPTRNRGYWYYGRSFEGREYGASCRVPVTDPDDWTPPRPAEDTRPRPARAPGRAGAARPRRAGRGPRVLLPRRLLGQPGRHPAGLLHRRGRRRALHDPGAGPRHRRAARRRDHRRHRRRDLGPRRAQTSSTRPSTSRGAPTRSGGTGWAPPRPTTSWSTTRPTAGSGSAWAAPAATGSSGRRAGSKTTSEYRFLDADDPDARLAGVRRAARGAGVLPRPRRDRRRGRVPGAAQRHRPRLRARRPPRSRPTPAASSGGR